METWGISARCIELLSSKNVLDDVLTVSRTT
jgi:hypothetical protein